MEIILLKLEDTEIFPLKWRNIWLRRLPRGPSQSSPRAEKSELMLPHCSYGIQVFLAPVFQRDSL